MPSTRYVTIVATVAVPDDALWDKILASSMHDLVEAHGLRLVPCGWAPDPDTIADAIGPVDGGTENVDPVGLAARVTVLDMNPPRVSYISMTGRCLKCGEPYIPDSDDDLVHLMREDGEDCGGEGVITGGWGLQRS